MISHPEGADLQFDVAPADWIADRVLPWGSGPGTRVCAVVPTGYQTYVRIFHHATEQVGTEWIALRWSEVARRTGRKMHAAVQFQRFGWPQEPRDGGLDRPEAAALVTVLRDHTSTPDSCWLAIWNGYGFLSGAVATVVAQKRGYRGRLQRNRPAEESDLGLPPGLGEAPTVSLPGRRYFLYRGAIDVVLRFEFFAGLPQTPNLWWPEDRAWFVASEIDFDSTVVGCTRSCAEALLNGDLEALEIPAEARLDIDGDTVNPRTSRRTDAGSDPQGG